MVHTEISAPSRAIFVVLCRDVSTLSCARDKSLNCNSRAHATLKKYETLPHCVLLQEKTATDIKMPVTECVLVYLLLKGFCSLFAEEALASIQTENLQTRRIRAPAEYVQVSRVCVRVCR